MTVEVWNEENRSAWTEYYNSGADMPSNLALLRGVGPHCAGQCMQEIVDTVITNTPDDAWNNWVVRTWEV